MTDQQKISIAAVLLFLFGIYLIWQGFSKAKVEYRVLPTWMYVVGGIGMLVLPLAYFVLTVFVVK